MKDYKILLIEDDEVDILNIQRGFQRANILNHLYIANDGIEALELLASGTIETPLVILLDINMPRMNGLEFLKAIKNDEKWKVVPVVVLTTSKAEQDRLTAYQSNVAGYIVKPVDFGQFVGVLGMIGAYWSLCELPPLE